MNKRNVVRMAMCVAAAYGIVQVVRAARRIAGPSA